MQHAAIIPEGNCSGSPAKTAGELLTGEKTADAVFLLNCDPALDTAYGQQAVDNLKNTPLVVAMTPFVTDAIQDACNVILPIAAAEETSGTFINVSGRTQSFKGMAKPIGEARPAWKVLRVMANFFKQDGFEFSDSQEVLAEMQSFAMEASSTHPDFVTLANVPDTSGICRVAPIPIYAGDMTTRHATALSKTAKMRFVDKCRMSPNLASQLGIQTDDEVLVKTCYGEVTLPAYVDETMADKSVYIHQGRESTKALGPVCENLTLEKV